MDNTVKLSGDQVVSGIKQFNTVPKTAHYEGGSGGTKVFRYISYARSNNLVTFDWTSDNHFDIYVDTIRIARIKMNFLTDNALMVDRTASTAQITTIGFDSGGLYITIDGVKYKIPYEAR